MPSAWSRRPVLIILLRIAAPLAALLMPVSGARAGRDAGDNGAGVPFLSVTTQTPPTPTAPASTPQIPTPPIPTPPIPTPPTPTAPAPTPPDNRLPGIAISSAPATKTLPRLTTGTLRMKTRSRPTTTTLEQSAKTRLTSAPLAILESLTSASAINAPAIPAETLDRLELTSGGLAEKISRFREETALLNEWLRQPGAAGKIAEVNLRLTQAKLDMVDRKLTRLQITAETRRQATRALCRAETERPVTALPEPRTSFLNNRDAVTSTLLAQALSASIGLEQNAEENIRALEIARTSLLLDLSRLQQFDHYAKMSPVELAKEESRIHNEAAALQKEVLCLENSASSGTLPAGILPLQIPASGAQKTGQESAPPARAVLTQIRESLSRFLSREKKAEPVKKPQPKLARATTPTTITLPSRRVDPAAMKKQIRYIPMRAGDPVHAVSGGLVLYAGDFRGLGKMVVVAHPGDICSVYGYLDTVEIGSGSSIETGRVIGGAGVPRGQNRSGVQFEVRKNGELTDVTALGKIKSGDLERLVRGGGAAAP